MLVPLSWLKEYVPIKLPLKKLTERLSEVGVGVENMHKTEEDIILELEITPNRGDLLSIMGVAREVAAIQSTYSGISVKIPKAIIPKPKKKLPISIKVDYTLSPRVSAVIIDGITIKESPLWMAERLSAVGIRSINNIVDITNFVMMEMGNPLHAFDYDQIKGNSMTVTGAVGGETFTSVDKLSYKLPKGANIIKDKERIIDLCGIKGGLNSGITDKTKRVLLWVAIDDGPNIRRTSQKLGLRSDASSRYERGIDNNNTINTLTRAASLILELAGGNVASDVLDFKKKQYGTWTVNVTLEKIRKVIGIPLEEKKIVSLLDSLGLKSVKTGNLFKVTIPTYRNDLQIEEDIIEEIARMYGYNKLPQTLPGGEIPVDPIPYEKDDSVENKLKELMLSCGLSEVNTYSLVNHADAELVDIPKEKLIHLSNPVSGEYDLLRPSLLINLLKAIGANIKYFPHVSLFELGKMYLKIGKEGKEHVSLAATIYPADYFDAKGVLEVLFEHLSLSVTCKPIEGVKPYHNKKTAGIFAGSVQIGTVGEISNGITTQLNLKDAAAIFEIDIEMLKSVLPKVKVFKAIPKYPPLIEDFSILADKEILTGTIIEAMKQASSLLAKVELLDVFEDTRTFRLTFQHPEKNLTSTEVAVVRKQILKQLKDKLGAELKG